MNPKILENAINRFLSCSKALCINDVCIEWSVHNLTFSTPDQEGQKNCVNLCIETGIGGNLSGDRVVLKLYLDEDNNRDLKIGYVLKEGTGLIDLVPEFGFILMYIDMINPIIKRLPHRVEPIGEVKQYLLKATETGSMLIGVQLNHSSSDFYESYFYSNNQGSSRLPSDQFALAVKQEVIKDIISNTFQGYEAEGLRIRGVSRDNIFFTSSGIRIDGDLTYSTSCGEFNTNIDLNYSLTSSFSSQPSGLVIRLNFQLAFADVGERIQATICGIIDSIDRLGIPYLFVPIALATLSPTAYLFTDKIANYSAGQQTHISIEDFEGISVKKVGERSWDILLSPVTALGKYGGFIYPITFGYISLDDENRIVITGTQDLDPVTQGVQEVEFAGDISSTENVWKFKIDEKKLGGSIGSQSKEICIVKDGNNIVSVIDWEIIDNPYKCFKTTRELLINLPDEYNTPVMADLSKGSIIISPQNALKIKVTFGPTFQRQESKPGEHGKWGSFLPRPGDNFSAKLKITYKVRDHETWQIKHLYVDLQGEITFAYEYGENSIFTGFNIIHTFIPDEILHVSNSFEALEDLWASLPSDSDFDLIHAYSFEAGVQGLRIEDIDGALFAKTMGEPEKVLTIKASKGRTYRVISESKRNVSETHFYIQRSQLTLKTGITFDKLITGLECRGDLLAVSYGKEVGLYNTADILKPILIGKSLFGSNVNVLHPIDMGQAFIATDGKSIQILRPPIKPKRSIVDYREKLSGGSEKILTLGLVDDKILYISAKNLTIITRGKTRRSASSEEKIKLNKRAKIAYLGTGFTAISDGRDLTFYTPELSSKGVLKGVSEIVNMEQDGPLLYLYKKEGETLIVKYGNLENPKIITVYPAGHHKRNLKIRGDRAFSIAEDGKTLQLYQVSKREINREKLKTMTKDLLQL